MLRVRGPARADSQVSRLLATMLLVATSLDHLFQGVNIIDALVRCVYIGKVLVGPHRAAELFCVLSWSAGAFAILVFR